MCRERCYSRKPTWSVLWNICCRIPRKHRRNEQSRQKTEAIVCKRRQQQKCLSENYCVLILVASFFLGVTAKSRTINSPELIAVDMHTPKWVVKSMLSSISKVIILFMCRHYRTESSGIKIQDNLLQHTDASYTAV